MLNYTTLFRSLRSGMGLRIRQGPCVFLRAGSRDYRSVEPGVRKDAEERGEVASASNLESTYDDTARCIRNLGCLGWHPGTGGRPASRQQEREVGIGVEPLEFLQG